MSKKKKKKNVPIVRQPRSLDYFLDNFTETCERCGQILSAHAYRSRSRTKSEAIYASCQNKGACSRAGLEICFIEKILA